MKRLTLPDVMLTITIVTTPLLWMRLVGVGGFTFAPYHFATLALVAFVMVHAQSLSAAVAVFRSTASVWVASLALVLTTFMSFTVTDNGFEMRDIFRGALYSAGGFCAGALIYRACARQSTEFLALASVLTLVTFFGFGFMSLASAGINPVRLLVTAITTGNPNVIMYELFLQLFRESGYQGMEDASANLRHEIFFSLLVASVLPLAVFGALGSRGRKLALATFGIVAVLVLFSLSRSVWLASSAAFGAVGLVHLLKRKSNSLLFIVFLPFLMLFVYAFVVSDFVALFEARITDDGSYNARIRTTETRLALIAANPLLPDVPHGLKWAHSLIVDYWSAAGIVGLLVSFAYAGAIFWLGFRHAIHALNSSTRSEYVQSLAGLALAVIPFTRLFTCPMGQLYLAEQIALGASAGLAAFWLRNRRRQYALTYAGDRPAPRLPRRATVRL